VKPTRYAEGDRERREEDETLNAADSNCYQAEKMLAEHGAKLTPDHKGKVEAALRQVREALSRRDTKAASDRSEELKRLMQEAGSNPLCTDLTKQGSGGALGSGAAGRVPRNTCGRC